MSLSTEEMINVIGPVLRMQLGRGGRYPVIRFVEKTARAAVALSVPGSADEVSVIQSASKALVSVSGVEAVAVDGVGAFEVDPVDETLTGRVAGKPLIIVVVAIGLPIALVLAWAYEVRPEELRPSEPPAEIVLPSPEPAAPTAVTVKEQRKSIVVLPFDNMSPDPGDAYFSDGLTEEIITKLSYLRSLRVISRTSAVALRGTQKNTRAIAEELNVQYVLEGSEFLVQA